MAAAVITGAPGIYVAPPPRQPALPGARMDVCAFVGIAPRGPARVPLSDEDWIEAGLDPARLRGGVGDRTVVDPLRPRRRSLAVPVESWDDYTRLFGRFEGPGRLPYAVAAFFEQGGRRAYVVRVVHDGPDAGTAAGTVDGLLVAGAAAPVELRARNEGSWGNGLRARLSFRARPLGVVSATAAGLVTEPDAAPVPGTLLRLEHADGTQELRFVAAVELVPRDDDPGRRAVIHFDGAAAADPVGVETVDATLELDDGDGRSERFDGAALGAAHPYRLGQVLCDGSQLVWPDAEWADADVMPADPALPTLTWNPFADGADGYRELVPEDFFDADWTPGDDGPADGVHALLGLDDLATVVVPDLYEPGALPDEDDVLDPASLAGPRFEPCADPAPSGGQTHQPPVLEKLLLDPLDPAALDEIVGYQQRLVDLAEWSRAFVVLLDVPPGLDQRRIVRWRNAFDSSFAAAYHPWLDVARSDDLRNALVRINPSAYAAGIVAQRELLFGVPYGPSNELAIRVVDVADVVSPERHDALHPLGINVFLRERDGIRLSAARTLSLDPAYRQLSVRRLVTMIVRALAQLQWLVFEPNNESLRADLRHMLRAYLTRLYRANAFAGATEDEAFFVRCDESNNPQPVLDAGQLVAEIGIAPAEPLEFIVLRFTHDGDGTLIVEGAR